MVTLQDSNYERVLTLSLPFMVAIFSRILSNLFLISSHLFTCPFTVISISLLSSSGEGDGTDSSALAWKIPWTEEPGGLQSMGL